MNKYNFLLLFLAVSFLSGHAISAPPMTDSEIRQQIILESIAGYSGNCPCPYNRARNGRRCGGRSAYSRAGGYAPVCFEQDISDAAVESYKKSHGITPANKGVQSELNGAQ